MSLTEYVRKRQFDKTREPPPGRRRAATPEGRAIFVVQLHHASRRHYDFRLQVGDALKSWAVPKGPSYDPDTKRMAVEVEDHPVDYATFEGEIPEGQYGAGHVALFDRGVWAAEGDPEAALAKGHLRFELFGERLKGRWHLVRSGKPARQPQWLLFKDRDEYAGPVDADDLLEGVTPVPAGAGPGASRRQAAKKAAASKAGAADASAARSSTARGADKTTSEPAAKVPAKPRRKASRIDLATRALALADARKAPLLDVPFEPQLARLGDAPPTGDGWLHEAKWDGYRLTGVLEGGKARLWSRNDIEWTARVPEVVAALEALGIDEMAFDGELVAGEGTQEDFGLLQATLSGEKSAPLSYVLFDLVHLDGVDLRRSPQLARKELLAAVLEGAPRPLAYSSHVVGNGEAAFAAASQRGLEGLMSKRIDAPYRGGRGDDWRKTKRLHSDEFAVVGYTAPKGARSGFGSMLLARPDADGWAYAGRVGTGFSDLLLSELAPRLEAAPDAPAPSGVPRDDSALRRARWIAPTLVAEVYFRGTGNQGLLRQPSLKAIREDKSPGDLADSDRGLSRAAREGASAPPASRPAASTRATAKRASTPGEGAARPTGDSMDYRLTSPDRVVYPDNGVTKREVAEYYAGVMDWLLPEIVDRPLSIVRCTQGVGRPCFFQKHHTAGLEDVDAVPLKEDAGNHADYLVVRNARAVMALVQFNAIELHPWGALAETPDRADRIVFDLDPGPGVAWDEIVAAAREVRDLLGKIGLVSYVRTTGGKGLHVVVPLNPGCDWDVVKPFAQAFATSLASMDPLRYVANMSKKLRNRRIFVDYLRNGRGATAVASFSLRSREGAPVSMPLRWEELGRIRSGAEFTLRNAPDRVRRLRAHPWAGFADVRQNLDSVGAVLEGGIEAAVPGVAARKRSGKSRTVAGKTATKKATETIEKVTAKAATEAAETTSTRKVSKKASQKATKKATKKVAKRAATKAGSKKAARNATTTKAAKRAAGKATRAAAKASPKKAATRPPAKKAANTVTKRATTKPAKTAKTAETAR
jgi:bifunctional non-homologous end joining protein LigD